MHAQGEHGFTVQPCGPAALCCLWLIFLVLSAQWWARVSSGLMLWRFSSILEALTLFKHIGHFFSLPQGNMWTWCLLKICYVGLFRNCGATTWHHHNKKPMWLAYTEGMNNIWPNTDITCQCCWVELSSSFNSIKVAWAMTQLQMLKKQDIIVMQQPHKKTKVAWLYLISAQATKIWREQRK